jgi:hypothetical protein
MEQDLLKFEYSGNSEPDFIIPIITTDLKYPSTIFLLKDNDYYIGDKTISKSIQSSKECNLKLTKKK